MSVEKLMSFFIGGGFIIPLNGVDVGGNIVVEKQPSLSYRLRAEKERIERTVDGLEAVKQMIYKTLMTGRYRFEIYDWNYGVELDDLIGKPKEFVKAELPRRIEEALIVDDRVDEVVDFVFTEVDKTTLAVKFVVKTNVGDVDYEMEVNV